MLMQETPVRTPQLSYHAIFSSAIFSRDIYVQFKRCYDLLKPYSNYCSAIIKLIYNMNSRQDEYLF